MRYIETEFAEEVVAEVAKIEFLGTHRRVHPVDHPGRAATHPEHVVLLEVTMNERRNVVGPWTTGDLDQFLPHQWSASPWWWLRSADVIPDLPAVHGDRQ